MDQLSLQRRLFQSCNPEAPATEAQYLPTTAARGEGTLVTMLTAPLTLGSDDEIYNFLFAGHVGCGKSTELRHLARDLKRGETLPRYYPIEVHAPSYLGRVDTSSDALLLAMVLATVTALRTDKEINFDASSHVTQSGSATEHQLLLQRNVWEAEQLIELQPQIGRTLPELGSTKALFAVFENKIDGFRELLRDVMAYARSAVKKKGYRDLLLLVDGLERLDKLNGVQDRAEALFINESAALRSLGVHVVYTAPLRLVRRRGDRLRKVGYTDVAVLPMVKVFQRPQVDAGWRSPYQAGCSLLKDILGKRLVQNDTTSEDLRRYINEDSLDLLILYSGGDLRLFLGMVRDCAADPLPINLASVERVIRRRSALLRGAVHDPRYWRKLAALDKHPSLILSDDDDFDMLENLLMLEYVNGDKAPASLLDAMVPWYAANPLLRGFEEFKRAQQEVA